MLENIYIEQIGIENFPKVENVGTHCELSIKSYTCKYLENYKDD